MENKADRVIQCVEETIKKYWVAWADPTLTTSQRLVLAHYTIVDLQDSVFKLSQEK